MEGEEVNTESKTPRVDSIWISMLRNQSILTHERLKSVLRYDEYIGEFFRLKDGKKAGFKTGKYMRICIDRITYKRSRLAWFYVHREWPKTCIDHIDGNQLNDSITNLRDVSYRENNSNLKAHRSGNLVGATFDKYIKGNRRWKAKIQVGKKHKFIGNFSTEEEAHRAYMEYRNE